MAHLARGHAVNAFSASSPPSATRGVSGRKSPGLPSAGGGGELQRVAAALSEFEAKVSSAKSGAASRDGGAGADAMEAEALAVYEAARPREADHSGLLRRYVELGERCYRLTTHSTFDNFILGTIIVAAGLVGAQTYEALEGSAVVRTMDTVVLSIFGLECILKLVSESADPWQYVAGPRGRWNVFDLTVVLLCLPFLPLGNSAAILRLARLARVGKVIDKVPKLKVLLVGITSGFRSILYIAMLLGLCFYLYGCLGVILFHGADPTHFGSLGAAFITLFQLTTMESWGSIMFAIYYGCNRDATASGGKTSSSPADNSQLCDAGAADRASPTLAPAYFISFVLLTSLVVLSMFIGAIALAMAQAVADINDGATARRVEARRKRRTKEMSRVGSVKDVGTEWDEDCSMRGRFRAMDTDGDGELSEAELAAASGYEKTVAQRNAVLIAVLRTAFDGRERTVPAVSFTSVPRQAFWQLHRLARYIVRRRAFDQLVTGCILGTALIVAIQCDRLDEPATAPFARFADSWFVFVQWVFTFELVCKVLCEHFRPLNFLKSGWNCLDLVVVVGGFVPDAGSAVVVLRLLRVLLILKMLKGFPQLQVAVTALVSSASSVSYIGVTMLLCFFVFAVLGIALFRDNDPYHFENLHIAIITLFQVSTLDAWVAVMAVNYYGCDKVIYFVTAANTDLCTSPAAWPAFAVTYFMLFIVLGSFGILNLFVGVITSAMEEATRNLEREQRCDATIAAATDAYSLDPKKLAAYLDAFALMDADHSATIDEYELAEALRFAGIPFKDDGLAAIMDRIDGNADGSIDRGEFVLFMCQVVQNGGSSIQDAANSAKAQLVEMSALGFARNVDELNVTMAAVKQIGLGSGSGGATGQREKDIAGQLVRVLVAGSDEEASDALGRIIATAMGEAKLQRRRMDQSNAGGDDTPPTSPSASMRAMVAAPEAMVHNDDPTSGYDEYLQLNTESTSLPPAQWLEQRRSLRDVLGLETDDTTSVRVDGGDSRSKFIARGLASAHEIILPHNTLDGAKVLI
jgi:hypothetical protein